MALTVTFDGNNNQITTKLQLINRKYNSVVKSYMVGKAKEFETYMKTHHPWQNRTGNAEAGLSAKVQSQKFGFVQTIELSHGVPYGVYLEYSMERRFAILEPTMRLKGHEVVDGLKDKIGMFVKVREV